MTLEEASFIEDYRRIAPAQPQDRDTLVGRSLLEALRDPTPALIYVDKYGLHNPYDDKFPPHLVHYRSPPDASARDKLIAAYKNGVRWCVDDFFKAIVPEIDFSCTALLYTSDHGQSMIDGGYTLCHCSTGDNVVPGEAFVPLFIISGDEATAAALRAHLPGLKDRASHFDIFPTLLALLGYDPHSVATSYGTGLFGRPSGPSKFLIGFKLRSRWVDVERVRTPALPPAPTRGSPARGRAPPAARRARG